MIALLSEIVVVIACALLLVLSVAVVGVMHRAGSWATFGLWLAVAQAALVVAAQWRQMPLPAALLLLLVTLMVWRMRRRIAWAVAHGAPW